MQEVHHKKEAMGSMLFPGIAYRSFLIIKSGYLKSLSSLHISTKKSLTINDLSTISGAAGIRTLVQTNPPYAFYMLI